VCELPSFCLLCFFHNPDTNTKREHGRKAQLANVEAARAVADIIRTTLGPQAMLKMILDPMGGIVMTNDGNCILREVRSPPLYMRVCVCVCTCVLVCLSLPY
jgi:hypothetical protein